MLGDASRRPKNDANADNDANSRLGLNVVQEGKKKAFQKNKANLNRLGKLTNFLVKRLKSHSTLDKACQHRLESNELNST